MILWLRRLSRGLPYVTVLLLHWLEPAQALPSPTCAWLPDSGPLCVPTTQGPDGIALAQLWTQLLHCDGWMSPTQVRCRPGSTLVSYFLLQSVRSRCKSFDTCFVQNAMWP